MGFMKAISNQSSILGQLAVSFTQWGSLHMWRATNDFNHGACRPVELRNFADIVKLDRYVLLRSIPPLRPHYRMGILPSYTTALGTRHAGCKLLGLYLILPMAPIPFSPVLFVSLWSAIPPMMVLVASFCCIRSRRYCVISQVASTEA
ncbi:hypothetical protein BO94DRAFT_52253 [Aspergillus sclerotioniger CBS 115572]|uniref:Uncharacterized protein n=1 Tax=Aspergillus sclerotioniger CBS 115572 TaxID=1450535 RepID=A0A317WVD6_9EURO|nr:hypothetical protein BO94DRAFT_52253 [Aspergillus sclerotioniger CBS 115572]PWY88808.1 hypothetical protein BO94DRAFT_52253 [Aspergillus sclerotioniger CBS 115572]